MSSNLIWSDYLTYDETSPSCLRWKVDIRSGRGLAQCHVKAGDPAGTLSVDHTNYWMVGVGGKIYAAHKIVAEMLIGQIPKNYQIDHIDGNKHNNKISNLRVITKEQNMRNLSKYVSNTSGVCGVYLNKKKDRQGNILPYWAAQYRDLDGKQKTRYFSVRKFGYDGAFHLALEFRERILEDLNKRGAGYTERHGKEVKSEVERVCI